MSGCARDCTNCSSGPASCECYKGYCTTCAWNDVTHSRDCNCTASGSPTKPQRRGTKRQEPNPGISPGAAELQSAYFRTPGTTWGVDTAVPLPGCAKTTYIVLEEIERSSKSSNKRQYYHVGIAEKQCIDGTAVLAICNCREDEIHRRQLMFLAGDSSKSKMEAVRDQFACNEEPCPHSEIVSAGACKVVGPSVPAPVTAGGAEETGKQEHTHMVELGLGVYSVALAQKRGLVQQAGLFPRVVYLGQDMAWRCCAQSCKKGDSCPYVKVCQLPVVDREAGGDEDKGAAAAAAEQGGIPTPAVPEPVDLSKREEQFTLRAPRSAGGGQPLCGSAGGSKFDLRSYMPLPTAHAIFNNPGLHTKQRTAIASRTSRGWPEVLYPEIHPCCCGSDDDSSMQCTCWAMPTCPLCSAEWDTSCPLHLSNATLVTSVGQAEIGLYGYRCKTTSCPSVLKPDGREQAVVVVSQTRAYCHTVCIQYIFDMRASGRTFAAAASCNAHLARFGQVDKEKAVRVSSSRRRLQDDMHHYFGLTMPTKQARGLSEDTDTESDGSDDETCCPVCKGREDNKSVQITMPSHAWHKKEGKLGLQKPPTELMDDALYEVKIGEATETFLGAHLQRLLIHWVSGVQSFEITEPAVKVWSLNIAEFAVRVWSLKIAEFAVKVDLLIHT